MKKIKLNFILIIIITSLASCTEKVIDSVGTQSGVTFSSDIRSVAAANCSFTCHNPRSLDAGLDLSTDLLFISAAKDNSLVIERIENGSMPPTGRLSDEEIALFTQWRNEGFLE